MTNDGEIRLHLETLGVRLRRLRNDRGHSLVDVANGTGLSTSFLSLVENGRSDISTGRLYRVAHFLGVGLADLLDMEAPPGPHVVRTEERRAVDMQTEGLVMYPLADDRSTLSMGPLFMTLEPGCGVDDLPAIAGTEHFGFVIAGTMTLTLHSGTVIVLEAGDSLYLTSDDQPRRNVNDGDTTVEAIWVFSPPAIGPGRGGSAGLRG